ncbi:MAG: phosphodiesterase [Thermoleophilia bacterium]|nr:phosphodiesterase [Thermoleophilia bacterium]
MSSLLPYDICGRRLLFGARVLTPDEQVASMQRSYEGLRIELMLGIRTSRFHPIATLVLGEPLPGRVDAALDFDPWNTGPDIVPAGFWNRVRAAAYAGSRAGRR